MNKKIPLSSDSAQSSERANIIFLLKIQSLFVVTLFNLLFICTYLYNVIISCIWESGKKPSGLNCTLYNINSLWSTGYWILDCTGSSCVLAKCLSWHTGEIIRDITCPSPRPLTFYRLNQRWKFWTTMTLSMNLRMIINIRVTPCHGWMWSIFSCLKAQASRDIPK